jgi:hypothetical protein
MKTVSKKDIIIKLLKENPDGMTVQDISEKGAMSRITATIYIHELLGGEVVTERKIGAYRLFNLKEKHVESVTEEELIKKLKEKIS